MVWHGMAGLAAAKPLTLGKSGIWASFSPACQRSVIAGKTF
jgi:hypothetical protein